MKFSKPAILTVLSAYGALPMSVDSAKVPVEGLTKVTIKNAQKVSPTTNLRRALQDDGPFSFNETDLAEEEEQIDQEEDTTGEEEVSNTAADDADDQQGVVNGGVDSSGDESDSDANGSDDVVVPTKRSCKYSEELNGEDDFKFKCKSKVEDTASKIKDELQFKIRTASNGLVIKVDLEQETETEQTETETETGFDIRFDKIIEYRKGVSNNGVFTRSAADSDAYEFGVDEVVAEWDMSEWSGFSSVTTSDDGNLLTFSSNSLDGAADFAFTIAQVDKGPLSANRMKIDFTLSDFPWAQNDTYVALISHIDTENDVKVKKNGKKDDEIDEGSTNSTNAIAGTGKAAGRSGDEPDVVIDLPSVYQEVGFVQAFGQYSWAKTAETMVTTTAPDGRRLQVKQTIPVIATIAPGAEGSKQDIAFSFTGAGRGADWIYWDPEAGVGYNTSGASSSRLGICYFGTIAAFAALVVSTMMH